MPSGDLSQEDTRTSVVGQSQGETRDEVEDERDEGCYIQAPIRCYANWTDDMFANGTWDPAKLPHRPCGSGSLGGNAEECCNICGRGLAYELHSHWHLWDSAVFDSGSPYKDGVKGFALADVATTGVALLENHMH